MPSHLVVGAGLIGRSVAERLAARGDRVTIATRSGSPAASCTSIVLNASDAVAFTRAAAGSDTIFLCTNPPYTEWATLWPPVFESAIAAASVSGAGLVVMGNLYPYGVPTGPMSEHTPEVTTESKGLVRREGWRRVRAAHDAGLIRAVEVRASDYFGPGTTGTAHLGGTFFGTLLASKTTRVVGDADLPHSWSYLPDIVTTLVAAADHRGGGGRIWHVPSGSASRIDIAAEVNERYGTHGKVAMYPQWLLRGLGLANPMMKEIWASSYQFRVPFLIDSAATERELGVTATEWTEALGTTAESYLR